MSSQKTTNLGLHKWVLSDPVKMAEFNENFQKIDAAIAAGAKIATGSYVGTGTYGSANPCSLTFDFPPRFLLLFSDLPYRKDYVSSVWNAQGGIVLLSRAMESVQIYESNGTKGYLRLAWSGNTLSWYYEVSGGGSNVLLQYNQLNTTYYHAAIL